MKHKVENIHFIVIGGQPRGRVALSCTAHAAPPAGKEQ
jgi:hypothetical protein